MTRPTASSWTGISCGDTVHAADDPRHLGRVRAVLWGSTVRIVWNDNGFISDLPLREVVVVERVNRTERNFRHHLKDGPGHYAVSPRRRLELSLRRKSNLTDSEETIIKAIWPERKT